MKGEGVPEGWALDRDGAPTTDAERALDGFLLPLGGVETHSGYKGFGLGMMVEIFCGILTGGLTCSKFWFNFSSFSADVL